MNPSSVRGMLAMAIAGLVAAVGLGWGVPAGAAGGVQDGELVFAGTWVLNDELSDEAQGRDRERRGGGRGRFGGRGGQGPDPERIARMREAMREAMAVTRRVTISGDRSEVVLTLDDGRVVRHVPDGREHADQAGSGAQVTRTARWRGETLEVEIELALRRTITMHRTFELQDGADGGRQLVVTSRVEGGRGRRGGDRENRRVYDAAES